MSNSSAPIGFFDSGVGGLSVLREVRRALPWEDVTYVADSLHVPYGSKSAEFILARSRALAHYLIDGLGCKALVIACNTATVAAAAVLRKEYPQTPIIAMEPAVKPAVAATRQGIVGVLATVGTLQSAQFAALLDRFAGTVQVVTQPAPGLVESVEAGALEAPETIALVQRFLEPILVAGADVVVLGCTHYPFLRSLIQRLAGPDIVLIDTGAAVARQLATRLTEAGLLHPEQEIPREIFLTSGDPVSADRALDVLWPGHSGVSSVPSEVANSPFPSHG